MHGGRRRRGMLQKSQLDCQFESPLRQYEDSLDEEGDALRAGATPNRQTAEAVGAAAGAPAAASTAAGTPRGTDSPPRRERSAAAVPAGLPSPPAGEPRTDAPATAAPPPLPALPRLGDGAAAPTREGEAGPNRPVEAAAGGGGADCRLEGHRTADTPMSAERPPGAGVHGEGGAVERRGEEAAPQDWRLRGEAAVEPRRRTGALPTARRPPSLPSLRRPLPPESRSAEDGSEAVVPSRDEAAEVHNLWLKFNIQLRRLT